MSVSTGFLHPGAMGSTVAAACSGDRWWAGDGRSDASRHRAATAGLRDAGSVEALVERVDTVVSVCPPASALVIAQSVAEAGFTGIYVDANAVAPHRAVEMAGLFEHFVDGGIIGPPAEIAGTTRMYLSGPNADATMHRWDGGPIDDQIGSASALKMSYAAWTKGRAALLLAVNALGDAYDIGGPLRAEWAISQPDLEPMSAATARGVAPKGWRFEGEMHEIADTFEAVGLPGDFHRAAADIYGRLTTMRDAADIDLNAVLTALRTHSPRTDPSA